MQMDDADQQFTHLRALMLRHGITSCTEIEVMEEDERRRNREEAARLESLDTTGAPN